MKESELEDKIESLEIQLKHLKNDYNLTKREKEKSIKRYLEILFDLQERNKELQYLQKNLEKIVEERTEELKKSEEKYRSLFNNMLNGFAYCKMLFDENNKPIDFIYLDVNDSFERLTGLKKENVLGKKVTEAIPGIKDTHPELIDIYGKVTLTGENAKFDIHLKPLDVWLNISVYSPKKEHFVAVFDSITERKKAEEELAEAKHILETIFNTTHMLVAYLDPKMNFIKVNRAYAEADEREPSFFLGKNHFDLYPNAENERIFNSVVELGKPYFIYAKPFEYAKNPERGVSYWDWSLIPIKSQLNTVSGLILTLANVTERKKAEEERLYLSKLEGIYNLVVTVNHEMNQSLSVITSYSGHLLEELEKGNQAHEDAQMINKEVWKLAELVKRIAKLKETEKITFTKYSKGVDMVDLNDTNEEENE